MESQGPNYEELFLQEVLKQVTELKKLGDQQTKALNDFGKDVVSLRGEMQATRELMKKYNGLREKLSAHDEAIAEWQSAAKAKNEREQNRSEKNFKRNDNLVKWAAIIISVGGLGYTIFSTLKR